MKRRTLIASLGAAPAAHLASRHPLLTRAATPATSQAATSTPIASSGQPIPVRVMTFNVWIGGEQVDFDGLAAAIRQAGADVVGVQEVEGNLRRLAAALGWRYANPRLQIISRYPIIDPPGVGGGYVLIQLAPGAVFGMTNVHLPSDPYGTHALRDGAPPDEVMALEEGSRMPPLRATLEAIAPVRDLGIPVVFTGDFNSPSHLDWVGDQGTIGGIERIAFAWPTTTLMAASGFQDTYRVAHPDPVAAIGYTWPAGYPAPLVRPGELFERIDYVWATEDITVVDAGIVGEAGGADVTHEVVPFPSDHRAVVSALEIVPATPPVFVAVEDRAIRVGEPLLVRFHARGDQTDTIAIVPRAGDGTAVISSMAPRETWVDGSVSFGTGLLAPGAYDAVLLSGDGEVLARSPFWLLGADDRPMLEAPAEPVVIGHAFDVAHRHAPGNRWDWIALVAAPERDLQNYLGYWYTDAGIDGSVTIDTAPLADTLAPGRYRLVLLLDDGYVQLAETFVTLVN